MSTKKRVYKRYSEPFKRQVVAEYEAGASLSALKRKYDIGNLATIKRWVAAYGREGLRHTSVYIQTPEEADQYKALQKRIAQLESALAKMTLEKYLLEGTLKLYQETYGHELAEKKGHASQPPTNARKEPSP